MEKQTEKFRPWKKQVKDGKQVPQKLPGVLTPRKNDTSVISDSAPCPSPTEHKYKPRFFDKPEWLSSDKENMPPIELVTLPSLRNLSLEEEINEPEHEATSWEANVVRNLETLPRSSSPYPRKTSTLEDLEPDTDDNMVDITEFFERLPNEKRSPKPKQNNYYSLNNSRTMPHTSKHPYLHTNEYHNSSSSTCQAPQNQNLGDSPGQKKSTPCLRRQPPRVAFKNNDIYIVDDEESSNYKEPRERHSKVQYKLQVCKNPAAKNMPYERGIQ